MCIYIYIDTCLYLLLSSISRNAGDNVPHVALVRFAVEEDLIGRGCLRYACSCSAGVSYRFGCRMRGSSCSKESKWIPKGTLNDQHGAKRLLK